MGVLLLCRAKAIRNSKFSIFIPEIGRTVQVYLYSILHARLTPSPLFQSDHSGRLHRQVAVPQSPRCQASLGPLFEDEVSILFSTSSLFFAYILPNSGQKKSCMCLLSLLLPGFAYFYSTFSYFCLLLPTSACFLRLSPASAYFCLLLPTSAYFCLLCLLLPASACLYHISPVEFLLLPAKLHIHLALPASWDNSAL